MEARVVAVQDGVTTTRAYEVTKETVPQTQLNHCCILPQEEFPTEKAGRNMQGLYGCPGIPGHVPFPHVGADKGKT